MRKVLSSHYILQIFKNVSKFFFHHRCSFWNRIGNWLDQDRCNITLTQHQNHFAFSWFHSFFRWLQSWIWWTFRPFVWMLVWLCARWALIEFNHESHSWKWKTDWQPLLSSYTSPSSFACCQPSDWLLVDAPSWPSSYNHPPVI